MKSRRTHPTLTVKCKECGKTTVLTVWQWRKDVPVFTEQPECRYCYSEDWEEVSK